MIYFNNAATGYPKPEAVIKAIADSLRVAPSNSYRENVTEESEAAICRYQIARLFEFPDPQRIILCSGATEALNIAINGIARKGTRVITTHLEHNSVLRPLYRLRDSGTIELDIVPCSSDGRLSVKDIKDRIRHDTCLAVVNQASNVTGIVQDIDEIYGVCGAEGIPLIVDMSQSAGCVPVDLSEKPLSVHVFTGHKSLHGPSGTGGLLVGTGIDLEPWKVGGTGVRSDLEAMPEMWPLKYEPGTMNHPGVAALAAAIGYVLERGIAHFGKIKSELAEHLYSELKKMDGISLYSEAGSKNICGVISFTIPDYAPNDVGYILSESFDIRVRTGLHCAPLIHKSLGTFPDGTVRVSFSAYNTHEEVEEFVKALKIIRGTG